jgi:hypothetical protein
MQSPWTTPRALRARMWNQPPEQRTLTDGNQSLITVDIEVFFGLTPWVSCAVRRPPTTGWWKTRMSSSPLLNQPQRRWYNGHCFSLPVFPNHNDDEAEEAAREPSTLSIAAFEWCGLTQPHPHAYPYKLMSF